MSAILRHRYPNRFTVLPNDAIRNPALSFRAVGVLAHLLSLPDGAKVDSATLAGAHREGRDAVRSAYKELEAHGYYRRAVIRLADGTLRTEVVVSSTPMSDEDAGPTEDGFSGVGPGPENPAPVEPTPVEPTPVDQAPKEEVPTTQNLIPPQPPRPAGGQEFDVGRAGPPPGPPPGATEDATGESAGETPDTPQRNQRFRRGPQDSGDSTVWAPAQQSLATGGGRSSRAAGTNPRADAERAEAERLEAEAARRQAELERRMEARRAADRGAEREAEQLDAEAHSISAALNDETLCAVVAQATAGLSGLLAGSTVAVTRAVVAWCRAASATRPGSFINAVTAGLAGGLSVEEGRPPLALPAAPAGTTPLRDRLSPLVRSQQSREPEGKRV